MNRSLRMCELLMHMHQSFVKAGSWAVSRLERDRGLSMNRPLFAVPPFGGRIALDRLKPELQTCQHVSSWSQGVAALGLVAQGVVS